MPACSIYNEEHQQLLVKFYDTVTADDLEEQATILMSNNIVGNALRRCISFLSATGFGPGITMDKIQEVVAVMGGGLQSVQGAKTAFVAPGEEALGIALMFKECLKRLENPGEIKIFTTKQEAVDWLDGGKSQWIQMREHVAKMCAL